jgi:hypothetical protein
MFSILLDHHQALITRAYVFDSIGSSSGNHYKDICFRFYWIIIRQSLQACVTRYWFADINPNQCFKNSLI